MLIFVHFENMQITQNIKISYCLKKGQKKITKTLLSF